MSIGDGAFALDPDGKRHGPVLCRTDSDFTKYVLWAPSPFDRERVELPVLRHGDHLILGFFTSIISYINVSELNDLDYRAFCIDVRRNAGRLGNGNLCMLLDMIDDDKAGTQEDAIAAEQRDREEYNGNTLAPGAADGHACAHCATPGVTQRCSKCKLVYYCGRECQLAHWEAGHNARCAHA